MKIRWILAALICIALLPAMATAVPHPVTSAAMLQDHGRDHDWDHDRRFEGRSPGFRMGFRDAYNDGRRDRETGRRWHYGPLYKETRGYRPEFGSRDLYRREYRSGYDEGYREGYGPRR